jgi:hypothetical protein
MATIVLLVPVVAAVPIAKPKVTGTRKPYPSLSIVDKAVLELF